MVATGGKPDIGLTGRNGREWPHFRHRPASHVAISKPALPLSKYSI